MKWSRSHRWSILSVCLGGWFVCVSASLQEPPATPKRPVQNVYHGITVIDDFRWLENFSDPQVKQWIAAENGYTRSVLDKIPGRTALAHEIDATIKNLPGSYGDVRVAGGKIFAL